MGEPEPSDVSIPVSAPADRAARENCPQCGGPMACNPNSFGGRTHFCEPCQFALLDDRPSIRVKRLRPDAILPTKSHPGDLGWDLYSADYYRIAVGSVARVRTGIAVEPPPGYGFVFHERSSQGVEGVSVKAGVIDYGYRGELIVVLHNAGADGEFPASAYMIKPGDRIAQAILTAIVPAVVEEVEELAPTTRGESGFGSSGR